MGKSKVSFIDAFYEYHLIDVFVILSIFRECRHICYSHFANKGVMVNFNGQSQINVVDIKGHLAL